MRTLILLLSSAALAAAQQTPPTVAQIYDNQLKTIENELVPLVEAMPESAMSFAPTQGEFKNVRKFKQQATHVAAVNYMVCAAVLGEKNPSEAGANENGPATIDSKADVLKYVKDSFAYCHKAMQTLTAQNLTEMMPSPFGNNKMPKASAASIAVWHGFDHYGQMVIYARMNGIVPPASR